MSTLALEASNNATWRHGPITLAYGPGSPVAINEQTRINMHVRATAADQNLVLDLNRQNGRIIVVSANASTISIEVPVTVMRGVPAGDYVFDLLVTQGSGTVYRLIKGTLSVDEGVTKLT